MATVTEYLNTLARSPLLEGIATRIEVCFGLAAQHIIATAESYESDLVVLCSHGRTGFTRWALGSVAHTLVHQSTVPVLVLRESESMAPLSGLDTARPLYALIPLDGSPLAEAALNPAAHLVAALASPAQGALHLAQVVKMFPTTAEEGFITELNEEALQRAKAYLAQVEKRLQATAKSLKLSITSSVTLEADAASALVSLAEQGIASVSRCHLIAISTHGRGGLERWVMGSVTERILNATKLPMLIVRPQHKA
jgi:nucleotide-binding universal stress UspA family protein